MSTPFHNTIKSTGQALLNFEAKVMKQTDVILALFEHNKDRSFTPWEAHAVLFKLGYNYPITSVRRAMSDLTKSGELIMHEGEKQKKERYGMPNNQWQYNLLKIRS